MNPLEVAGFVFGIAGIWLTIKEHWTCFPVGLANVIISLFIFIDQKLYSDAVQQGVYIILLSYGWYQWKFRKMENRPETGFTDAKTKILLFMTFIAIAAGMGYFFDNYSDAHVPYLDATATALSFIAQYLIAKKKIENWLIWMVVNVMYIGIYGYKGLYFYMILFAIYLILSIIGFVAWRKEITLKEKRIPA